MTLEFGTLTCAEPMCGRTTPGALGITWTCHLHSGPAVWPAAESPCSDDADCGRTCYLEGAEWVYETTRSNGWGGDEDVQAICQCEHHQHRVVAHYPSTAELAAFRAGLGEDPWDAGWKGPLRLPPSHELGPSWGAWPDELRHGIGYRPSPPPDFARWHADPWAGRIHGARVGAYVDRSRCFAMRWYRLGTLGMHPGRVQVVLLADGRDGPVVAGDPLYVAAWQDERRLGCPAWT